MLEYLNSLLPSRPQSRPLKALEATPQEKDLNQTMLENQQQIIVALNQIRHDQFELRNATHAGLRQLQQTQIALQQKILSKQEGLESRQHQFFQEQRFMMQQLNGLKSRILSLQH